MRATCQLICYVFSLLNVLFLGGILDTRYRQTGFLAKHILGGQPLPIITEFLIEHHRLPRSLLFLPWLAFVGLPVLWSSAARDYWDTAGFFLRLAAFVIVESWMLLIFLFAIAGPFIPYYGVVEMRDDSTFELMGRMVCWGGVGLIIAAAIFRAIQRRRHP